MEHGRTGQNYFTGRIFRGEFFSSLLLSLMESTLSGLPIGIPVAYDVLDLFRVSDMGVSDVIFRWLYAWFVLDLSHQYVISAVCSVLWAWALFP